MSEEVLGGRIEIADVGLPFTPSLSEAYDNQPIFRILIDVSESCSMGLLQKGYYIKLNESVYYVRKKEVAVFTNTQAEKLFKSLRKRGWSLQLMLGEIKQ